MPNARTSKRIKKKKYNLCEREITNKQITDKQLQTVEFCNRLKTVYRKAQEDY